MRIIKKLYQLLESDKKLIVLGVLLTSGLTMPLATAGEAAGESPDPLQSGMWRNQLFFDQQMSELQEGMLQDYVSHAGTVLEQLAEQRLREIEFAVEDSLIQRQQYAEELDVYPLPTELGGNASVCIAIKAAADC